MIKIQKQSWQQSPLNKTEEKPLPSRERFRSFEKEIELFAVLLPLRDGGLEVRVQGVDADFEVVQLLHQRGKVFGLDAVARHSRVDVDGHFESRAVLRKGGVIYLFYLINLFLFIFYFLFKSVLE